MKGDRERVVAEIGIVQYPRCQRSAVQGLTDLFWIAGEVTAQVDKSPSRIRVTHWAPDAGHSGSTVRCVWDSHPGGAHSLETIVIPPAVVPPEQLEAQPDAAQWLASRYHAGSRICSVCAGAFLLAESGLIDGRRVTTHWAFAQSLAERYPLVAVAEEHMIVDDGDIVTAGGMMAWTDLGLVLVERLLGPSVMLATARFLLIDPPRRSQQPFSQFVPRFDHGDETILRVQQYIHAHIGSPSSLSELASNGGLSVRTLIRRFTKATGHKPTDYIQRVRVAKARESLELTTQTVELIAWDVGYSDPAAFRKVFRKQTGLSPSEYRRRFGIRSHPRTGK